MAVNWSNNVNKKFYGVDVSVKENVIRTEFESGRVSTVKKDSRSRKTYNVNLMLWTRAEELAFWTWFNGDLQSGAKSFTIPDVLTQTGNVEYIFDGVPTINAGTYPKELTFTMEEV